MAISNTTRFGLPQWGEGTDPRPGRIDTNTIYSVIEQKAAMFLPAAPLADRPEPGIPGRLFPASDQGAAGRLYYDTGTSWIETGTGGGGGAGKPVVIAGTATEGISNRSARADHTHNIPLATPTNHGAMASQWAELIENSTAEVRNNALLRRTNAGHVYLPPNGYGFYDAVPRYYVDDATSDVRGATPNITGGVIVKRWSSGHVSGPDPDKPEFYATKRYVDGKKLDAGDITSGQFSNYRVGGSRDAYYNAWNGSGQIRSTHTNTNGDFCFYSSTIRHKINVTPWRIDPRKVFAVEPVEFDRLNPYTGQPTGVHDYGVIAEEAGKHLPMYMQMGRDAEGNAQVEGWSYEHWVTALQIGLRDLDKRDFETQERISDLEAEVDELRASSEEKDAKILALETQAAKDKADISELRSFYNDMDERIRYLEDPNA